MILTIAFNPSVEKTAIVDGMEINTTNVIQDYRLVLGSSAIYSAYVIKVLQGEPYVLGFAGGIGGRYIKNYMDKNKMKSDLLWKEQETRSTLKIIDSVHQTETIFADDTFELEVADLKNLKHKVQILLRETHLMIINCDDHHPSVTSKMVEELIRIGHDASIRTMMSMSGDNLRKAIQYSPYFIVINDADLQELNILPYEDKNVLLESLRTLLLEHKIKFMIYKDDTHIYAISRNKVCAVSYSSETLQLPLGLDKDIITGALSVAVSRKYELEKMLRLGAACLMATNIEQYPTILTRKNVDVWMKKLKVLEIYNQEHGYSMKRI